MRLIGWLAFIVTLSLGLTGFFWYLQSISKPGPQSGQLVVKTEPKAFEQVPSFNMLLLQVDANQEKQRLLTCDTANCVSAIPPASVTGDALFDGNSWYLYVAKDNSAPNDKNPEIVLQRRYPDSQMKTIVEQTPLVRPRGLYISPNGQKVAYWLDNIDNDELTELWLYDGLEQGTRLVAEKITTDDVLTRPRFNRYGNYLWFIADNGIGPKPEDEKIELVLVDTVLARKSVPFESLNWQEHQDLATNGIMDISLDGQRLAAALPLTDSVSELLLEDATGPTHRQTIRGRLPYLQWLEEDTLLYVIQEGPEFIFWKRLPDGTSVPLARLEGVIRSAHGDSAGRYVSFVANNSRGLTRAYVLQLETGLVRDQGEVPPFGQHVNIVHANPTEASNSSVAGITTELTPNELTSFTQTNITTITGEPDSHAERILTTDQPNTIFVDYRLGDGTIKRLLLIVRDAIHKEWTVRARYQQQHGEWQQVQGGYLSAPTVTQLYEWEDSQSQWILKETYQKSP